MRRRKPRGVERETAASFSCNQQLFEYTFAVVTRR